ncbi:MAG: MerR family transcriptional regulator [Candidatus Sumerlaea chitinivorans]|jgi:DNA-binding transcriptional MerR regulator|nr:MerR family transcriptional regulator [Candidatus Sumerlaea chitinivorans]
MSEDVKIPDKLFYRINEVAAITGLKPYVLRYWETEFPMLSPEKDENEQRRYRKSDIELILQIKKLLYEEGYTIAGARKRLKQLRNASATEPELTNETASPDSGAQSVEALPTSSPVKKPASVDPARVREINAALAELRSDLSELYRILGQ